MKKILPRPALLLALAALASCQSKPDATQQAPPETAVTVLTQPVRSISQNQAVPVSGALEADQTVNLGFVLAGQVREVRVREGGAVRKGQVLATLDGASYQFALDAANAALARAQDQYGRLKIMFDRGSLTASDFNQAQTAVAQARAQQDQAAKNVRDTRLLSPLTGHLARRGTEPGQVVGQGTPVFTIVSDGRLVMRAAVPEAEVGETRVGLPARVRIPALDSTFTGRIEAVGPVADPASRTYSVKIALPNAGGLLRPGMVAEAALRSTRQVQALTVPGEAVVRDADQLTYVFVADAQRRRAFRRRVAVGSVLDQGVEITSGLRAGEQVVVGGQQRLRDGAAIQLSTPPSSAL